MLSKGGRALDSSISLNGLEMRPSRSRGMSAERIFEQLNPFDQRVEVFAPTGHGRPLVRLRATGLSITTTAIDRSEMNLEIEISSPTLIGY